MPVVRGCNLPDDLLYDVENNMWFKEIGDGNVRVGMTAVAAAMAGQLVACTPKKVGRKVEAGKSCATVESGKWVGPAKSAAAGEVVKINEKVVSTPATVNADPYVEGWLIELKAEDWENVKKTLTPGSAVAGPYEAKMTSANFAGCAA